MMKRARFTPEWMAYTGLLVAMQVVLGAWVQIPLAWKQFNFGFLPVAVAGALMGAPSAMVVGLLGDFIGTHLSSTGAYDLRFSLTYMIVGLVYGLLLYHEKPNWVRCALSALLVCCVNLFLNTYWLLIYIPKGYGALLATRWWTYLPEIPIQTVILYFSIKYLRKLSSSVLPKFEPKGKECKQAKKPEA